MNNYNYKGYYGGVKCYQFFRDKNNTFEFDLIRKYVIDNKILESSNQNFIFSRNIKSTSFYFSLFKKYEQIQIDELMDIDYLYVNYFLFHSIFGINVGDPVVFKLPTYILKTINENVK